MRAPLLLLGSALALTACKTPSSTVQTPLPAQETELRMLDTMMITAESIPMNPEDYKLPVYRASESLPNDLKHTKLRIAFDWSKEQVIGQATLKLEPTFYPQTSVTLDAKNFEFKTVRLGSMAGEELKYDYDGKKITIQLPREYKKGQEFEVYLDYTSIPQVAGGSSAITSDKGLFFINADGSDPEKPQQIWTQGETQHNSNWMPTLDQPNERSTQEFWITVQDKYKTLSNGLLISSTPAGEGMRTDYWRMDQPHAPYLHMIAVGEFAKVDDTWRNIPLSYYVEPAYEKDAKEIFAHTPEMLEFFSKTLGVDYPWPKYSQIIVRDYVSGAMENTSAVIFGEFVQKTAQELEEDNNDLIVAHEMFHHWFGDLVTTESWSNLTLNEGFANYSEYLWFEHNDGVDAAEDHRLNELQGYLGSGRGGGFHPLIWYQYESNEDMFDGHSYNKGGLVLHMLRKQLGDEAFFAALQKYLKDNQYTAVEVDELRMAFEDTVGEDLNWFFDQWFIGNGHPIMTVDYGYTDGKGIVTVEQTQDVDDFRPIFVLPTKIVVYPAKGGTPVTHDVRMDKRKQTFSVDASADDLIVFDPESTILGVVTEMRPTEDQVKVFERVPEQRKRLMAIRDIRSAMEKDDYSPSAALIESALTASSLRIRNNGIAIVDVNDEAMAQRLMTMARTDKSSNVRAGAIEKLASSNRTDLADLFQEVLDKDKSFGVQNSALQGLYATDPTAAIARAKTLENTESNDLLSGVAMIYAMTGDAAYLPFFESKLKKTDNEGAGEFAGAYLGLALQGGPSDLSKAVTTIGNQAKDQSTSPWRRYGFTSALAELRQALTMSDEFKGINGMDAVADLITTQINAVKTAETNPQLKAIFGQM